MRFFCLLYLLFVIVQQNAADDQNRPAGSGTDGRKLLRTVGFSGVRGIVSAVPPFFGISVQLRLHFFQKVIVLFMNHIRESFHQTAGTEMSGFRQLLTGCAIAFRQRVTLCGESGGDRVFPGAELRGHSLFPGVESGGHLL